MIWAVFFPGWAFRSMAPWGFGRNPGIGSHSTPAGTNSTMSSAGRWNGFFPEKFKCMDTHFKTERRSPVEEKHVF
jgi:hypothetical protein